jgi:hypothetical protein
MDLIETLSKLVDEGKTITFYYSPDEGKERLYTAEISKKDEEIFVYAQSMQSLLAKLERKDIHISTGG